jgi:NAD(P)-dependent dehydrogenase (short-subunit alcohol dehydrogenase family)
MKELFDLTGRVALVTGGSKGLGKEMALALADAGADVAVGARHESEIVQAAKDIAAATGRRALGLVLDVTDRDSVRQFVAQAAGALGRIDILVNNAGLNIRAPLEDIREEDWRLIQDVNVTGVFHGLRVVKVLEAGAKSLANGGEPVKPC